MPLPLPNLDDRDHEQLLREAVERIREISPDWNQLSPSDPGVVLLDIFVHLTDTLIHRTNRVPEKIYRAFLRTLGVSQHPPAAARVKLRFTRKPGADVKKMIEIPRNTRVTLKQANNGVMPIYITTRLVTLGKEQDYVDVLALHADEVEAERVGYGTGAPGLSVLVSKPPMIDDSSDPLDVVVGVAAQQAELVARERTRQIGDTWYRLWREVKDFNTVSDASPYVYMLDRMEGMIIFPPAPPEHHGKSDADDKPRVAAPEKGREIRVWYRRGGGLAGNVMANCITSLIDKTLNESLDVTNPDAAVGGRPSEPLEMALQRAPGRLRTLDRAVTADDYETITLRISAIARARASNSSELWTYAPGGMAQVTIVPDVPENEWPDGIVTAALLRAHEAPQTLELAQTTLNEKRTMGTECRVNWAAYKSVRARAKIIANREENIDALRDRVLARLHRTINPLPSPGYDKQGWAFGSALRISHIYDAILAERGVRWVDNVDLVVDDAPTEVSALAADYYQPNTWYAGSQNKLFRSLDGGDGWEHVKRFEENSAEQVEHIEAHPKFPGVAAAITSVSAQADTAAETRVYVTRDCGESWSRVLLDSALVEDIAWSKRDQQPLLFIASSVGLFAIADPFHPDSRGQVKLERVTVDGRNPSMPLHAVTCCFYSSSRSYVIVAAQDKGGVFAAIDGGSRFRPLEGMKTKDVRVLNIQEEEGERLWLWAGTYSIGESVGDGCFRWELRGSEDPIAGWEQFGDGWQAGGCYALDFLGEQVFAATHRGGVLRLDPASKPPRWQSPDVNCGLPVRDLEKGRFLTINTLASDPKTGRLMAGVKSNERGSAGKGVYRARQSAASYDTWKYEFCSSAVFRDRVTLPATWLIVSGEHEITVVSEDDRLNPV